MLGVQGRHLRVGQAAGHIVAGLHRQHHRVGRAELGAGGGVHVFEIGRHHGLIPCVVLEFAVEPLVVAADQLQRGAQARRAARAELPDGSFLDSPRTAPMGSALCGAIGTSIARKRRTLAVVGDGSALMFMAELATAARHQAPVTIVVCVNGVLGAPHVRTSQLGSQSSILCAVDWPGIAAAFGVAWSEAGSQTELFGLY